MYADCKKLSFFAVRHYLFSIYYCCNAFGSYCEGFLRGKLSFLKDFVFIRHNRLARFFKRKSLFFFGGIDDNNNGFPVLCKSKG